MSSGARKHTDGRAEPKSTNGLTPRRNRESRALASSLMRNALITGTSTGIGEACVARLAEKGWTVYAGVRRAEDGDRVKAQHPGDVRPVILDVMKRDDITRVIDDLTREVGDRGLQALVNNAGVGVGGPFEYVSEEDWRWVFDVNFFAVVALTQAAIPLLRTRHGHVVHIGSIGGRVCVARARALRRVEARARGARRVAAPRVRAFGHADQGVAHRTGRDRRPRSGTRPKRPPTTSNGSSTTRAAVATAGCSTRRAGSSPRAARRASRRRRSRRWWSRRSPPSSRRRATSSAATPSSPATSVPRMPDRVRDAFVRFNSSMWEKRGRGLPDRRR